MNKIREKLTEIIAPDLWPSLQPSKKEVSLLLFAHKKASLQQIQAYLGVEQVFDQRLENGGCVKRGRTLYLIDIFSRRALYRLDSISRAFQRLMIAPKQSPRLNVSEIIAKNYVFHVNANLVVLSITPRKNFRFENLTFLHKLNMSTFRLFLDELSYTVDVNTDLRELRALLGFNAQAGLKTMMQTFGLEWHKRTGDYSWKEHVYVKIVSPFNVSRRLYLKHAAREINIHSNYVRGYINRGVFFKYNNQRCFFIFAE